MAMMKKKPKEPERKKPYQGSLVVVRHPLFDEQTRSDRTYWQYVSNNGETIKGDMQPSCCDLHLRQLFKTIGMEEPVTRKGPLKTTLTKKIPAGLLIDSMEEYGENRVQLHLSGNTESDFNRKIGNIHEFCDKRKIGYEDYCLFICVTQGKQKELTDNYLREMDKLRAKYHPD